jgi:hypothetical protein
MQPFLRVQRPVYDGSVYRFSDEGPLVFGYALDLLVKASAARTLRERRDFSGWRASRNINSDRFNGGCPNDCAQIESGVPGVVYFRLWIHAVGE